MQLRCSKKRTIVCVLSCICAVFFICFLFLIELPRPSTPNKVQIVVPNLPRLDSLDYDRFKDPDFGDYDEQEVVENLTNNAGVSRNDDSNTVVVFVRENSKWRRKNVCQQKPLTIQNSVESSAGKLLLHMVANNQNTLEKKDFAKQTQFELLKLVHSNLAFHTNSVLIDVGAGDGRFSILAAKIGKFAISVESNVGNIYGLCASVEFANAQPYVTIIQNNSSMQTEQFNSYSPDHILVIDEEISCVKENGFSLDQLVNLETLESQTRVIVRIEAFHQNAEKLLICADDFFANFDVLAIIMPWAEHNIQDKKKLAEHLSAHKLIPHETIGVEKELLIKNVEYWPLYVIWKQGVY
ncbi:uncharacterized protein LOC133196624 [Saccostrea echinata]|uniref:uncharacterized protein LOC133196624 n=1 Tax=Saccostrea echinata TaxID=191078 RepID=UPI002A81E024|nr:uncharacterized protein LOC133196624 [Saccostrea echinata]